MSYYIKSESMDYKKYKKDDKRGRYQESVDEPGRIVEKFSALDFLWMTMTEAGMMAAETTKDGAFLSPRQAEKLLDKSVKNGIIRREPDDNNHFIKPLGVLVIEDHKIMILDAKAAAERLRNDPRLHESRSEREALDVETSSTV